jgi:hypothetical protein
MAGCLILVTLAAVAQQYNDARSANQEIVAMAAVTTKWESQPLGTIREATAEEAAYYDELYADMMANPDEACRSNRYCAATLTRTQRFSIPTLIGPDEWWDGLTPAEQAEFDNERTRCIDQWLSSSTGQGTCSWHGGIAP